MYATSIYPFCLHDCPTESEAAGQLSFRNTGARGDGIFIEFIISPIKHLKYHTMLLSLYISNEHHI